mgnify:FL=1
MKRLLPEKADESRDFALYMRDTKISELSESDWIEVKKRLQIAIEF